MLVSFSHVTKSQADRKLLDDVEMHIDDRDKIGILGVNGTGKSTLLKMIAGLENYEGKMIYGKDIVINYLPQTPNYNQEDTIIQTVYKQIKMQDINEYEINSMLGKFGIYDKNQKIKELSGGQIKRVALAIALVRPCQLLILDEPTNHLDNGMIEYLEKFLIKWSKGLLMVTHDRYFLERVVSKIIEIDHGKLYSYEANYSKFLELKELRLEAALASQRKRKLFLKKELEWVRAGAPARTTKKKDRLQRFEKLSSIEDIEVQGKVEMIRTMSRLGGKTIELVNVSKSFGDKMLFDEFSYMFKKHDRIGILGDNGTGKSTLLNIITGNLESDTGYVDVGETVKFGYFKQGYDDMPYNKRVIDYIQELSYQFKSQDEVLSAKDMLERFLFDGRLQHLPIGRLSGGEKRRLYLLRVLMENPNVLVLDEPTNDLDIDTLQILEDYLDDFPGIILTVSHDRYFLDRICDGLFIVQNQHITYLNGGYSQTLDTTTKVEKVKNDNAKQYKANKQQKIKMTYLEKKEFDTIEDVICDLEEKIQAVEDEMNEITDYQEIAKLTEKRDDLMNQLDEKNERFLYLLELQEAIEGQG